MTSKKMIEKISEDLVYYEKNVGEVSGVTVSESAWSILREELCPGMPDTWKTNFKVNGIPIEISDNVEGLWKFT